MVPRDKKTGNPTTIITINLQNYKVHRVINSINDIIDISIVDTNWKEKVKKSVSHYRKAIEICRKKMRDHTHEEIKLFDEEIFFLSSMGVPPQRVRCNQLYTYAWERSYTQVYD